MHRAGGHQRRSAPRRSSRWSPGSTRACRVTNPDRDSSSSSSTCFDAARRGPRRDVGVVDERPARRTRRACGRPGCRSRRSRPARRCCPPARGRPGRSGSSRRARCRRRGRAWVCGMRRVAASIIATVCSAVAVALRPGAKVTATPRAVAASRLALTGPPRLTQNSRRSGEASRIFSVSGASWVTQTSAPRSASIICVLGAGRLVDLGDPAERLDRPRAGSARGSPGRREPSWLGISRVAGRRRTAVEDEVVSCGEHTGHDGRLHGWGVELQERGPRRRAAAAR